MRKVFKLDDLGCANCAAKMEREISRLDGVSKAQVNFLTSKLTLEADDGRFDEIVDSAAKICRRIEPDCVLVH